MKTDNVINKIEYELRYSNSGGYYFIDKIEANEGFSIVKIDEDLSNTTDVEELIRRANNYDSLLSALKEALFVWGTDVQYSEGTEFEKAAINQITAAIKQAEEL